MRIAQIAGPFESVPPTRYGGTERLIATLTDELVRRGHDVTLFAAGGSQTAARLVPVVPEPAWHRQPPYEHPAYLWTVELGSVMRQLDHFDVLHSHLEFYGFPLARQGRGRVLSTMHGRQDLPEAQLMYQEYAEVPLVSISNAQREPVPTANWIATVYNGIDLTEFTFNKDRGSYLAFLGRISPEKGLDTAMRVAIRAQQRLKIAARLPVAENNMNNMDARRDREYYHDQILPLARESQVEFIGEIGGSQRDVLLRDASALLFPVRWPEPFGLVMAEALACGTPVLGLRHGSVAEIVENGVTGFVCDTEDELVEAIGRIPEIDRSRCRAAAERRFSAAVLAENYERVYAALSADSTLAGAVPPGACIAS